MSPADLHGSRRGFALVSLTLQAVNTAQMRQIASTFLIFLGVTPRTPASCCQLGT